MPNRILRDWTDSLRFDGISAEAERMFLRLIMKADDFGRYHAEPRLLKAGCFPLQDQIRPNDLHRWLDELSHRQLILRYEVSGRTYLAILNFGQRLKQSRPKFPPPPGKPDDFLPVSDDFRELPGTSGTFPSESDMQERKSAREADPNLEAPPLAHVLAYAQTIGLAEWKARDWLDEMTGAGWLDYAKRPVRDWKAVIRRVKVKWEADGRPMSPTTRSANGRPPRLTEAERDRQNTGLNEGIKLRILNAAP